MRNSDIFKMKNLISDQLEFKVGDLVYHRTPGGSRGVVLDWRIYGSDGSVEYFVSFGPGETVYSSPLELSTDATPE